MTRKKKAGFAAIFDWDGVIIDSSEFHERSWELLAEEKGLYLPPDHFKKGFGMKNEEIIPGYLDWTSDPKEINALSVRKEELYRELIKERGIAPLEGVKAFLDQLKESRIPCIVGSSTPRINIDTIIDSLGFTGYFMDFITAGDVKKSKPDPEVFLLAAERVGYAPGKCVVFEDALMGVEAGKAAGMKVVAITTTNSADKLTEADVVVNRLDELTVDKLRNLF